MVMTLGATYNNDYGRIQVTISGAALDADFAKVEWSKDQITWSTIRGGDTVPLVAGVGHIDHYDGYVFGITNYYRVTAVDNADPASVGTGTVVQANNANVSPPLPGGLTAGNVMVAFVTHFNTGVTISVPTGWTRLTSGGANVAMFYRVYQAGDTAPTFSFTGGAAGDSCSAFIRAFSNVQIPVHLAFQSNTSQQNVPYPAASAAAGKSIWLAHLWKASTTTGATAPTGFIDQQGAANTTGANNETNLTWRTANNIGSLLAGTSTWTGGAAAVSRARLAYLPQRLFTDQGITSLTPVLPSANVKPYWLMNPHRPGQNVRVEITEFSSQDRDGRVGLFPILGRSYPIAVTDTMSSRNFSFEILVNGNAEADSIDGRFAAGEPLYLLAPSATDDVPTLYFSVTKLSRERLAKGSTAIAITVDCVEVAQPKPSVYGDTFIWSDVTATYVDWTAVVAGNGSWSQLVDKVSSTIIVVP